MVLSEPTSRGVVLSTYHDHLFVGKSGLENGHGALSDGLRMKTSAPKRLWKASCCAWLRSREYLFFNYYMRRPQW
ncbi:hypothetical protein PanWU01x14_313680 [Parasponia andersonii]|uniref:Uncharacterized protein n=1 Tax=Parasponia andersonii TaxID=3476 RepID=A0A2P5AP65_PARAD|nr:hypothetical protein PanWU01x14_313680 [Parasponia andersonii]